MMVTCWSFLRGSFFSATSKLKMWRSNPKSWYCNILTISVSITNAIMVVYPQLCFPMGEQDEEDGRRRWGGSVWTCHVKLLDQWRCGSAQSRKSIGELSQSAAEKHCKSSLLISTDWNVSLSPAPSGNRSRILSLLFLIAQEDFLGRGFGQWTRWTRSRIHAGGTNRTPYSSFAVLTRWVSSVLDRLFFSPSSLLSGMQRMVQRPAARWGNTARYCLPVMFWPASLAVNSVGRNQQTELLHVSVTHAFWHWLLDIRVKLSLRTRQLSVRHFSPKHYA